MSRRTVFGSLLGLVFLVNLARVVFAPLLDPLGATFQANDATLGLVATAAWLGSALPRLPVGYLLTRVSRKRVVVVSGAVLTAAATGTSSAGDVRGVILGAFAMGLASGTYFIAANPLVSELFPRRVGSALGVHGMASQLAAVGAPAFVLAAIATGDWRTVIRAIAVAAALSTVAFGLAARRTELPVAGADDRDLLAAIRRQWRIVLTGVVVVGGVGLVWNGLFNFYVRYLLAREFASGTANGLLTLVFAAGVPAFVVTGRLADRVPVVPLLLAICGGFVACVFGLIAASSLLAVAVVSAVLGFVVHSVFPAADTYLLGSLPDRHRASAYATYSALMMIVQASGSTVVGQLSTAGLSYDQVFAVTATFLAVVVLGLTGLYLAGRIPSEARE